MKNHFVRCFLGGIVAILPVGGLVLGIVWAESLARESLIGESFPYFPGLGLLLVVASIYVVGLFVTTVLGKWLWSTLDRLLDRLPLLGPLYRSLKQILGYGEGGDALFERVVLVPHRESGGVQIGLVTSTTKSLTPDANYDANNAQCAVFIPDSPNPMAGRLVLVPAEELQPCSLSVHDTLKTLVAIGKTDDIDGVMAKIAR